MRSIDDHREHRRNSIDEVSRETCKMEDEEYKGPIYGDRYS